ncbi:hypothetical protein MTR67_039676 [Solanum verrucosum]|uniref:Protein kinase domain-containing protein n=1 Tax=Solanum verrucosum TaxID=315347 RepID=A0AAF0ZP38_SOLVR|nr:hypothetical protein MTR67_039676 [Solanum verrucosum]
MNMEAEENKWLKVQAVPKGQCDLYNTCGPFGSCKNNDSPICKCLKGYELKSYRFTQGNSLELPVFRFKCIETATKNFCYRNKLGEGRFGPVYKGILADGQEVAIKQLWRSLGQDIEVFKNEVTLISELQHRNLVKLMGFCINGEEKLMIYEYMSNRSLDVFILGGSRSNDQAALSWNIVEGIARGLLNLHRDF